MIKVTELPMWVQLLATGVALLAWFEARMVLRRECSAKHADVDVQLKARHTAISELRGALTPLMVEVGKLGKSIEAAEAQRRELHEDVRAVRDHLESRACAVKSAKK